MSDDFTSLLLGLPEVDSHKPDIRISIFNAKFRFLLVGLIKNTPNTSSTEALKLAWQIRISIQIQVNDKEVPTSELDMF